MAVQTPLLTLEAANLYAGVSVPDNPNNSNHLRLTDVKLPGLDEQYVDHRAAGAPIAIEINTVFARLQCDFTLAGWSVDVADLVDSWGLADQQFWIYGALRDRTDGSVEQAIASLYGRLGRADPQLWRRGDVSHWAYSIRGITRYKLTVADPSQGANSTPLYEWDYFNNIWNVDGISRSADINAALAIPTPATAAPGAVVG